jgi:hypothetical protein
MMSEKSFEDFSHSHPQPETWSSPIPSSLLETTNQTASRRTPPPSHRAGQPGAGLLVMLATPVHRRGVPTMFPTVVLWRRGRSLGSHVGNMRQNQDRSRSEGTEAIMTHSTARTSRRARDRSASRKTRCCDRRIRRKTRRPWAKSGSPPPMGT